MLEICLSGLGGNLRFQRAGMTVQAERLNFLRFLSHFRAVHRGASFAGLRTTSVRKLLPEYVLVSLLMAVYCTGFFHSLSIFSCHIIYFPLMHTSPNLQIMGISVSCSHT